LRLAESDLIAIDNAEAEKSEVAHGASGGSDVERIARGHEHDDDAVELALIQHGEIQQGE
jgi:hypothetical protein